MILMRLPENLPTTVCPNMKFIQGVSLLIGDADFGLFGRKIFVNLGF